MKFIKEWSEYNPKIDSEVKDFVEINKYNLPHLWQDDLTEDENINFMINYFKEFPEEMKSNINVDNIVKLVPTNSYISNAPILQKIGDVYRN